MSRRRPLDLAAVPPLFSSQRHHQVHHLRPLLLLPLPSSSPFAGQKRAWKVNVGELRAGELKAGELRVWEQKAGELRLVGLPGSCA
ncbi:hypothetical protein Droror1_Dr00017166 [Drosera rotundifolia]